MDENEPATIRAWQQGDEQATYTLFQSYYPRAVRLAALSGLSMQDAQDCAQEAFLRAFERRSQLRDPQAFPLWFHRIITRHILNALQTRHQGKEISLETSTEVSLEWVDTQSPSPDEVAIHSEGRARLWQAIQKLPSHYRVPIVLRYYGDFSLREVADLMGKREGTIRVIIHRALQQLRAYTPSIVEETALPCVTLENAKEVHLNA